MTERFMDQLRRVNAERAQEWCGEQVVSPLFWATELGGEVGEALNEVKKLEREAMGWRGSRTTTLKLADVVICLDGLARHYGIDLQQAVIRKFNATSEKQGFPHKLEDE